MILPREGLACNQTTNSYYNLLNNQIISFLGIISSLVKLTRIEENATLGKNWHNMSTAANMEKVKELGWRDQS
jgi:hypothetical protein